MCFCNVCAKYVRCGNPNCTNEICNDCEDSVMASSDPRRKDNHFKKEPKPAGAKYDR